MNLHTKMDLTAFPIQSYIEDRFLTEYSYSATDFSYFIG